MITVDEQLKAPLYAQIYTQIREDIIEGRLPAGGRLPSSRMLAKQLQVSRGTVETAYDQLMSEGYIEGQAGRGCFVCRLEHVVRLREAKIPAVSAADERDTVTVRPRYDCSPFGIDTALFPHATWQRLHRRVATEQRAALYESGEVQGEESLRAAIAAYLYQARQVHCTTQQIIIGAGADYLLLLLGQLLPKGLRIAMEQPVYPKACRLLTGQGFTVCQVSGDKQGMRTDALREQTVQVAYTMPSHQFPLGTVMPLARRLELIEWAAEVPGRYIIEDDYDSEFRYRGKPLPALQGYDRHQCVIYIGTFSKSITPSIRIGYLVLPPALLKLYQKQQEGLANTVSKQEQLTAALFLSEGFFERHINRMRLIYKQRYEALCDSLAAYPGLLLERSDSGLHVNVRLPHMGTTEAVKRAACYGVRVYPVENDESEEKEDMEDMEDMEEAVETEKRSAHLMIGFSALSCEELTEAVLLLAEAWQL